MAFGTESLELAIRYQDQASSVLQSVTGGLTSNIQILDKFAGKIPLISRALGGAMARIAIQTNLYIKSLRTLANQQQLTMGQMRRANEIASRTQTSVRENIRLQGVLRDIYVNRRGDYEKEIIFKLKSMRIIKDTTELEKDHEKVLLRIAQRYKEARELGKGRDFLSLLPPGMRESADLYKRTAEEMVEPTKAYRPVAPVTDEDIASTKRFGSATARLKAGLEDFGVIIYRMITPALTILIDYLAEFARFINKILNLIQPVVTWTLKWATAAYVCFQKVMDLTGGIGDLALAVMLLVVIFMRIHNTFSLIIWILASLRGGITMSVVLFVWLARILMVRVLPAVWAFVVGLHGVSLAAIIARWKIVALQATLTTIAAIALAAGITIGINAVMFKEMGDQAAIAGDKSEIALSKFGRMIDRLKARGAEDIFGNIIKQIMNLPDEVIPPLMEALKTQENIIGFNLERVQTRMMNERLGRQGIIDVRSIFPRRGYEAPMPSSVSVRNIINIEQKNAFIESRRRTRVRLGR